MNRVATRRLVALLLAPAILPIVNLGYTYVQSIDPQNRAWFAKNGPDVWFVAEIITYAVTLVVLSFSLFLLVRARRLTVPFFVGLCAVVGGLGGLVVALGVAAMSRASYGYALPSAIYWLPIPAFIVACAFPAAAFCLVARVGWHDPVHCRQTTLQASAKR